MSRKALKGRDLRGAARAGSAVEARGLREVALITLPDVSRELFSRDTNRTDRLLSFQSKMAPVDVAAELRHTLVAAVLRVPHFSAPSDAMMLGVLYEYAYDCLVVRGSFDLSSDLREERIEDWASALPGVASTKKSKVSTLRRVRSGERVEKYYSRGVAKDPYTPSEWWRIENAATLSEVDGAQVLVALLGRAGLRPGEASILEGPLVDRSGPTVVVRAIETAGTFRDVPVDAPTGELLSRRCDQVEEGLLLRPNRRNRKNTVPDIVKAMRAESAQFADFDTRRARHTYIARLMTQPVSVVSVCALAGIGGRSHLLTDLLPHVPSPTPADVFRQVRHTMEVN